MKEEVIVISIGNGSRSLSDLERFLGRPLVKTAEAHGYLQGEKWKFYPAVGQWGKIDGNVILNPGDPIPQFGSELIAIIDA